MPTFTYIASAKDAKIAEGEMEAPDQSAVIAYLEKHELFPLSVKEKKKRAAMMAFSFSDRMSTLDKIVFTRNLSLMIKAGIGIASAVDILLEDTEKPAMKKVLTRLKTDLEKGLQLSDALAQFPKNFPPLFINLLKAGESSGNLENSLLQISTKLKKESELRKKMQGAMAYPAILLFMASGVVILLVTFVLPRVSKVFAQANVTLPLLTRGLLAFSDFVNRQWLLTLILAGGFVFVLSAAKKSEAGRAAIHLALSKIPLVSSLMQKVALTRFTSTMHSLLKSGIPIIRALEITAHSAGNIRYQKIILDMTRNEIAKGVSLGMALKRRPDYFPQLTASMIMVGEKSGNLEEMLDNLAKFYEEEVDNTLKNLIVILEPLLLLCIGLMIGVLALSIIMPIYQMISTVR